MQAIGAIESVLSFVCDTNRIIDGLPQASERKTAMAKTSLTVLLATPPTIDRARIAATTEAEICAQAIADGDDPDAEAEGYLLVPPPHDLRRTLGLTQAAFAALLRVPIGTVRNWEQGRTPPDPAARTLLALVAADPAHAMQILRPSHADASGSGRIERSA